MRQFIALVHKDADSDFGVSFPDLPGCVAAGSSLDEARDMASEALVLHLKGLEEDGAPIPKPSSLKAIMARPEHRKAVSFLVAAEPKMVCIEITLPEDLLAKIDACAKARGYTRSEFLAHAAKKASAG
jgi:predicted RNase H-like HicB family nuclease